MSDQDREDFEAWCALPMIMLRTPAISGVYIHAPTREAWLGYQAALAHERARAASAPQVPDGWVLVPRWPIYEQMAKMAVEWGYTVEEAGGVYDVILDVCGKDAAPPAPVASHEPVAVERLRAELDEIAAAIGTTRFMDPPDGGDVTLAGQVRRMSAALTPAPPPEPAKAEVMGEPDAWQWRYRTVDETLGGFGEWSDWTGGPLPNLRGDKYEVEERPLYATPPTAPAAARSAALAEHDGREG